MRKLLIAGVLGTSLLVAAQASAEVVFTSPVGGGGGFQADQSPVKIPWSQNNGPDLKVFKFDGTKNTRYLIHFMALCDVESDDASDALRFDVLMKSPGTAWRQINSEELHCTGDDTLESVTIFAPYRARADGEQKIRVDAFFYVSSVNPEFSVYDARIIVTD